MDDRTRHLVLVAGAGRSGTSMIAGALSLLGVHVPLPHLKTNESNPRGFFESQWPVRFHRRLLARAFVEMADGRPTADRRVRRAVGQPQRDRLAAWLGTVMGESDQVLVKDPRSIWVPWLWEETAAELGVTTGFVTMLRHPAEVLGSRSTYYTGTRDNMGDFRFAVMNLCGWVNANLTVERGTRGKPRVFLRYSSLVEDWRPGLRQVKEGLGLDLDYDFDKAPPHELDEFIDPGLRRHTVEWPDLGLPEELVTIAEEVWSACCAIADAGGSDEQAEQRLDDLQRRYTALYLTAEAIARDALLGQVKAAKQNVERELRRRPPDVPQAAQRPPWRRTVSAARRRLARLSRRTPR